MSLSVDLSASASTKLFKHKVALSAADADYIILQRGPPRSMTRMFQKTPKTFENAFFGAFAGKCVAAAVDGKRIPTSDERASLLRQFIQMGYGEGPEAFMCFVEDCLNEVASQRPDTAS